MSMENKIKVGYEIETGKEVLIRPAHLIVTGVTQLSGKTTTLEALIKRSGLRAIVFKTKIGEKSFSEGIVVPPFFRDRSDYEFVRSLIEAYSKEKLYLEKGTLMKLCKGSASLLEIKKKVDEALLGKLRGIENEIYTRLQHYLENLIPQIQYANLSSVLTVHEGVNIMNLERFTEEVQALIIQSVANEVLNTMKGVIVVIPEAWKFIPQKYRSPCKRAVESFIRQGATNNNFVWIDSQDMAGVDKIPLKQISTWILGYQSERNEVKHTLDQIPLPKGSKPSTEEIMTLRKGHFYVSSYDGVVKTYVQPSWLDNKTAKKISLGKMKVEEIDKPDNLVPFAVESSGATSNAKKAEIRFDDSKIKKEITEVRIDFFNKIEELQTMIQKLGEKLFSVETKHQEINEDELFSKFLQKVPKASFDRDKLIKDVISRIPRATGTTVYEVAPLEKMRKDFQEEAKNKIFEDVKTLTPDHHKIIRYVESRGQGINLTELVGKCFFLQTTSGGSRQKVSKWCKEIDALFLLKRDRNSVTYPYLKERIKELTVNHGATEQEINQVYDHIIMEMLK